MLSSVRIVELLIGRKSKNKLRTPLDIDVSLFHIMWKVTKARYGSYESGVNQTLHFTTKNVKALRKTANIQNNAKYKC